MKPISLRVVVLSSNQQAFNNFAYLNAHDAIAIKEGGGELLSPFAIIVGRATFFVSISPFVEQGTIQISLFQREAAGVMLEDTIPVKEATKLSSPMTLARFSVGNLQRGAIVPFQTNTWSFGQTFLKVFKEHVLRVGQKICCVVDTFPLYFVLLECSTGEDGSTCEGGRLTRDISSLTFHDVE